MITCKKCKNKPITETENFNGFKCMICGKIETQVSAVGHGVVCYDCNQEGYCKWCGVRVKIDPRIRTLKQAEDYSEGRFEIDENPWSVCYGAKEYEEFNSRQELIWWCEDYRKNEEEKEKEENTIK
jgi:hypothetical protein